MRPPNILRPPAGFRVTDRPSAKDADLVFAVYSATAIHTFIQAAIAFVLATMLCKNVN